METNVKLHYASTQVCESIFQNLVGCHFVSKLHELVESLFHFCFAMRTIRHKIVRHINDPCRNYFCQQQNIANDSAFKHVFCS